MRRESAWRTNVGRIQVISLFDNLDFKGMEKVEAVKWITSNTSGVNGAWICDDDGDIGNLTNQLLLSKIESNDVDFFENEYVRFIARVEGLGTGFTKQSEQSDSLSPDAKIDFGLIEKVCIAVQNMSADAKGRMFDNLRSYRDVEFDRMKHIIDKSQIEENFSERRKLVCRYLLILFCHDFLWESEQLSELNVAYLNYLFDLIKKDDSHLLALIGTMTKEEMMRCIETFENSMALQVIMSTNPAQISHEVITCVSILDYLYKSNLSSRRVDKKEFVNEAVSNTLNLNVIATQYYTLKNKPVAHRPFLILDFPWLFSTEAKVDVLQVENYCTQNTQVMNQINQGLQNGNLAGLFNMQNVHLSITVRRDRILEDSLNKLSNQGKNLKKPLKVSFFGEAGVDAGGVRKEFFGLLTKELFNPQYAMFTIKNVNSI